MYESLARKSNIFAYISISKMKRLIMIWFKCAILSLCLAILSNAGYAQDTLGIGPSAVLGIPDSAYVGETYTFTVDVENAGLTNFYGNFKIHVGFSSIDGDDIASTKYFTNDTILAGQSISRTIDVEYDPLQHAALRMGGGNTVVVWPISDGGGVTRDSLFRPFDFFQDSIGIDMTGNVYFPTQLDAFTYDSIVFQVQNKSNRAVTKDIEIWLWAQSLVNTSYSYTAVDPSSYLGTTLEPFQTKSVKIEQLFDTSFYKLGGNTVVVWPIAEGMKTSDSLIGTITINATGIGEVAKNEEVYLRPNVGDNSIMIIHSAAEEIEQVRILDSAGRLVYIDRNKDSFYLRDYDRGVYLIEVLSNKGRYTFKVLKN